MKVCIIIPVFNEEEVIYETITTTLKYITELPRIVTLLIVNDGSHDRTAEIVDRMISEVGDETKLKMISSEVNRGYGSALNLGVEYAKDNNYDYVIHMDSDLTNHPKYIKAFYKKMLEGWDYIKASRYSKEGRVEGVPWRRKVISTVGNFIARSFYKTPLTDITNGFRAVKVDLMRNIKLTENGFVIIMEELYKVKRLTNSFSEIPYTLTSRGNDQGRSHFTYGLSTYMQYLKYTFKNIF